MMEHLKAKAFLPPSPLMGFLISPPSAHVVSYDQAPTFLQTNAHIRTGYRVSRSYPDCAWSIFRWSNELLNIWTHLIAALIMGGLTATWPHWEDHVVPWQDKAIFAVFLGSAMYCFVNSSLYHAFHCHSESACDCWFRVDLSGITTCICGCFALGLYYGFYCHPIARSLYIGAISLIFLYFHLLIRLPDFSSHRYHIRRLVLYSALVVFGFVPTMHWAIVASPIERQMFMWKIFGFYLLLGIGVFFYATRFPESKFPGKFDYVFSSHQLWHVFITMAILWWHHFATSIFEFRHAGNSCAGGAFES